LDLPHDIVRYSSFVKVGDWVGAFVGTADNGNFFLEAILFDVFGVGICNVRMGIVKVLLERD